MAVTFSDKSLSIKDIWLYTYDSDYQNRFDYMDRDVLKTIRVRLIYRYKKDRKNQPEKKFIVTTSSYPQYLPYIKEKQKRSKKQRKVKHQYEITLQLENMDWNSRVMWRTGSQRKWVKDSQIPWTKIKELHSTVRERFIKLYGKGTKKYKDAIKKHKRRAKWISKGDYISKQLGINGDWYWRVQPRAYKTGQVYGLVWERESKDKDIFFDKHFLRLIESLLKRRIISSDYLVA